MPAGAPWAVQVGALVQHKDPVNFVRAVATARRSVPALHGVMLGEGPLRGTVEDEIRRLGLEHAVHLAGHRSDADAILAAATVAVLSSEEEGLGTALLDAMAFGRPIAATRAGGIPEIVEHERSGLLAPVHDPETLGAAIARLVQDDTLAARIAAGATRRVQEFSVERTADRTIDVYHRLIGEATR